MVCDMWNISLEVVKYIFKQLLINFNVSIATIFRIFIVQFNGTIGHIIS